MKVFFFIVTFLFFSYVIVSPAKACFCPPQSFDFAYNSAVTVFVGKVISIERLDAHKERVTLDIIQSWKGSVANSTEVFTRDSWDDRCGYSFEAGKRYLIYTYKDDETFWVSMCSRTKLRKTRQAKDDIKKLEERINENKTKTSLSVSTDSRTNQWT